MPIEVIKASGEKVSFSFWKVTSSLKKAKIPTELRQKALEHLEKVLYPGIHTREIYKLLFDYLRKINRPAAAKYSLKRSIIDLGPSGYPFEEFIAKLFEAKGYKTQTNVFIKGDCLEHEIDIVAKKGHEKLMIECKFHNKLGMRTDTQVIFYIYARFLDIYEKNDFSEAWIVTNTKITSNVRQYAECKGIKVLSWEYPVLDNLLSWIEKENLHPITALTILSGREKEALLQEGIVLCRDFIEIEGDYFAKRYSLNPKRFKEAQEEAKELIS